MKLFHCNSLFPKLAVVIFIAATTRCAGPDTENKGETPSPKKLFALVPSGRSGIDFQNKLTEGLNTNILMYEYFYNGGGVAAGDLNGDDLIDLYFTSNMADNKLYLNRGDLRFQEISRPAGVTGRSGPWKTGVAFADINGDGRLDIYLSYSGMLPASKRINQLFINQGNDERQVPVFIEKAKEFGLASAAYSNQIYFFDYDRDGDLDAILLDHNPKSLPVLNETGATKMLQEDDPLRGIRLFNQENGFFEDVTVRSNISGSALTYGLGLGISDLNNDGWPDFYVSNDYAVPDYLYINNHDGTFTDKLRESIGHNSHFSMGNDISDINNDGLQDIFTLDMLPEDNHRQKLLLAPDNYSKFDLNVRSNFHYQYMRNMLQVNSGNGSFVELGQIAGVSNTDWSWSALFADFNNDGWKDLYVTNGYLRDYTNLDFINYMADYTSKRGRLQREDVLEIIENMPSSDVSNYMFSNHEGLAFVNATQEWGLEYPSNSNGAVYADLDNDGDLDLVVNNINLDAFVFENTAEGLDNSNYLQFKFIGENLNTGGIGAKVSIYYNSCHQILEHYPCRGYLSSVPDILHFGLGSAGKVDSVSVEWPSGKTQTLLNIQTDQRISLRESESSFMPVRKGQGAKQLFKKAESPFNVREEQSNINDFYRQSLLISEMSHSGPCMAKGDINGDGLMDVFVGGGQNEAGKIFLGSAGGKFVKGNFPALERDRSFVDTDAVLFDANRDGLLDLYVASGGYHLLKENDPLLQDRLYINSAGQGLRRDYEALPDMLSSTGSVAIGDVNNDGFEDLFIGGRVVPGRYPETPESFLLLNDSKGRFVNSISDIAPELKTIGMVTDAVFTDIDQDGWQDLVVVGEWMAASVFMNVPSKLINQTKKYFGDDLSGWWNAVGIADFNDDEQPDFILGNMGTNTQFKVSKEEPAEMFYSDFDKNGSVDPIFCFYIQGESYPFVTRDELLRQLVNLKSKYTSYESFADAKMEDIFSKSELEKASILKANHMETTLLLSKKSGTYEPIHLPKEAQYSPVYVIHVLDYNKDGLMDFILFGNNSHAKLRLGKFDANYGFLFKNNGRGTFDYIDQCKSGFNISGDVRSILSLNNKIILGVKGVGIVSYDFVN